MLSHRKSVGKPKKPLLGRRVVKDQDKADKRLEILKVAQSILEIDGYENFSVDKLAKKSGLAKGTIYLYFQTKEEIALEVLFCDYVDWFVRLREALQSKIHNSASLIAWIVSSLKTRDRFLKLMPLGPSILEKNVSPQAILKYKLATYKELQMTATELMKSLGGKDPAKYSKLLIKIHIAVIGAQAHGFQAPSVKEVIRENKLTDFDTDYFDVLEFMLKAVV